MTHRWETAAWCSVGQAGEATAASRRLPMGRGGTMNERRGPLEKGRRMMRRKHCCGDETKDMGS
jgi:hypothetical protein